MEVWKADDPLDRMIEEIAGELNAKGEAKKWIQTLNQNMFATNGSLDFVTSEDFQAMGIPLRVLAESRRKKAASSPSSASPSPSSSSNSSSPSTSTTSSPASSSSSVSAAGVGNLTKFQNLNLNPVTPLSIPSSSTPATPTSGASSGRNDRLSGEKERDDPRKKLSHSAKLPEELRRGSLPVSFATSPLTPTSTSSSSSVSSSSSSSSSPSSLPSPSSSSSSSISRTSDEKKSSRRSTVSKKLSGKSKKEDPDQWMGVVNILSSSNDLIEKLLSYAGVDSSQKPDGLSFTRRYGIYDHSVSCQFYCNLLNASADYPIIWIFLFSFLDARTLSTLVDRFVTPRPKDELPAIIFAVLDKDKSVSGDRKTNVTEHVITESYLMTNSISLHNISSAKDCCFLFEDAARAVTREVVGSKSPDLVKKLQNAMQKQRSELMLPKKQISILPNQIYWLRLSLQRIRLDGNSFKFFPLELTDLPSLHEITLNNNQITEIPDCIQKLRSLQRLELENNRIEELPIAAIQSMVSLQDLKLKGNPLTKLPKIKGDYLQFVRDSPVPVSSIISSSSSASSNPFGQEIEYRSSESSAEKALFGMDLGERMKLERKTFPDLNLKVPKFVLECSRFILKYALSQEGVFRIGGTTNLITAIQESVDTGKFTEFKAGESPHNVTGLLKLYLRKLPECALLFSNFDKITALADLNWDKQQIEMKKILKSLPEDNYNLAKLIFRLMYLAGINNDLNRMDFGNVAKVVGPNLLFSLDLEKDPMAHLSSINSINDVLTMATQAYPEIFEDGSDPFEEEPFEKDTPVVLYRRLLGHTKSITSIVVSKDQKYLWTTDSNGYFRIWDTDTHKCIKQVNTEKKRINAMAIIGSDVWLGFMDGLQIRNCSDGTLIKELPGFPVFAMSVINDDIWIGDTGKFTVFTVDGIKETITFENGMTPVIFTQVAKDLLWVASTERKIGLFDLNSHIFYEEFDSQHTSRITSVVLVDESSVWTTADDGHIIVWDATTGELREKLPSKHNSKVFGASPFGDQVWSYSWNGEIHIWDRKTALYQGRVTDLNSDAVAAILPIWSPSLLCWKVYTAGWDRSVSVWLAKGEPQSPSRSSSSSPSSSADDVLPAAPEDPVPEEPSSPALSPEHSPDFDDLDEEAPQNLSSSGEVETDSSKPRRPAPSRSSPPADPDSL